MNYIPNILKYYIISQFIFFISHINIALSLESNNIEMLSIVESKKVILRWSLNKWPKELMGFIVKKRFINNNADNKWQTLNTIIPDDSVDKDWSIIDKNLSSQKSLKKSLESMIKSNQYVKYQKGTFVKRLAQMKDSEIMELKNNIINSPDYALMFGFGLIDRDFSKTGNYEYGLFQIISDNEQNIPAATVKCRLKSIIDQWLQLYGVYKNGIVQLRWTIKDFWPENTYGFMIKKKKINSIKNKSEKWVNVTKNTIYPEIDINKDWLNLNILQNKKDSLIQKLKSLISLKKLNIISKNDFLKFAFNATLDELKGTNFLISKNFDYALITGFGCLDNKFSKNDIYEYGIFSVNKKNLCSNEPVSTFIVKDYKQDDQSFSVNLNVLKAKKGTILKWKYNIDDFHARALAGYNIYRQADKDSIYEKLNKTIISTINKEKDNYLWHYIDRNIDNTKKVKYKVAPVDIFNNEYFKTIFNYNAKLNDFDILNIISNIKIIDLQKQNKDNVLISWDFNPDNEKYIKGFFVLMTDFKSKEESVISDLIPASERTFLDKKKKKNAQIYSYQIKVLGKQGLISKSNSTSLYYIENLKLPEPDAFKAEYIKNDDNSYVKLKWNQDIINFDNIKNYAFFSDISNKGNIVRHASISINKDKTEYMFSMGQPVARVYTFGIAAKSKAGVVGEISYANCYVPLDELPPVKNVNYTKIEKGNKISIKWIYDNFKELDGFEIIQKSFDTKMILYADKNDRQWISNDLSPNTLYKFQITALSSKLGPSKYNKKIEYFYIQRK